MNQEQRNDLRRLAAAIRVGSQDTTQCFGFYWVPNENGGRACAMMAGAIGFGLDVRSVRAYFVAGLALGKINECAPGVFGLRVVCPCGCARERLDGIIEHLNDHRQWTREAIADWLDGLADQDEQSEATVNQFVEMMQAGRLPDCPIEVIVRESC